MSKVMVSIPQDLLGQIDAEAGRRATSRSAFLAAAARRELAAPRSEQIAAAIARSEARFAGAGSFDSAELILRERDRR